jgi:hypothetical protein
VLLNDPVISGVVTNLARPSSNVTGFTNFEVSMGGAARILHPSALRARFTHPGMLSNSRVT